MFSRLQETPYLCTVNKTEQVKQNLQQNMSKMKIPGVSFSLNRALGITQAKQKFARETGIPTSKAGLERKIGKMVINAIFGKK